MESSSMESDKEKENIHMELEKTLIDTRANSTRMKSMEWEECFILTEESILVLFFI